MNEIIIKNYKKINKVELKFEFPKYSSSIMNIISNTFQATRPSVVGKMSEIIPQFKEKFYKENNRIPNVEDWKNYYLKEFHINYDMGLNRIKDNYKKIIEAANLINEKIIEDWYEDFIIYKNYEGFMFEKIIKDHLRENGNKIINSTSEEERKNIDFWILYEKERKAFNIKPDSFDNKYLIINSEINIIRYKKDKDNLIYWFEN